MAKNTLGIYWDAEHLRACLVRSTMAECVIERLFERERVRDEEGEPDLGEDLRQLAAELGAPVDSCIAALPADQVMSRSLVRPFSDRRKIAGTVAVEMETLLPMSEGELLVDFISVGRDEEGQTQVEAFAAAKADVRAVIRDLSAAGLEPEVVDAPQTALIAGLRTCFEPEAHDRLVVLHVGVRYSSFAVFHGEQVQHVGAIPAGFSQIRENAGRLEGMGRELVIALDRLGLKSTDYALIPAGLPAGDEEFAATLCEITGMHRAVTSLKEDLFAGPREELERGFLAVSLALRGVDRRDALDFRQGDLAFTRKMERIRGYAGTWAKVLLVLLVVWGVGLGTDTYLTSRIVSSLDEQMNEQFTRAMPRGTPVVAPLVQMKQRRDLLAGSATGAAAGGETALEILRAVSAGIPASIDVVIEQVIIDEDAVTLGGSTSTYDNVEKIKSILGELGAVDEVKIVSANVDKKDQRVKFKLVGRKGSAS